MPESAHSLNTSNLLPSTNYQDEQFSSAFTILREAIAQEVFPCASIAVTHHNRVVALKALGRFNYESAERETGARSNLALGGDSEIRNVDSSTLFDLASLTKPIATTTMAMLLYERGLLDLDTPVFGTVPELISGQKDPRREEISFRMLLAHSSGLPAYEKLFLNAPTRNQLLHAAFTTPLTADPAARAEYSDIGFIILGAALERIAEDSLDLFCQREVFGPLAMIQTTFNPPAEKRNQIPPTADERDGCSEDAPVRALPASPPLPGASQPKPRSTFRHRIIQGEVQDENASVLGGVAGHAGLFSTAEDVARFAHAMLHGGSPILRPETVSLFTRRESQPHGTTRTLGWDTPSSPSQSGKYFSPRSYGHLGYTGTSLWIDPDRQLSITLLTNRTWPNCSNQAIKQLRPRFHDAIIEALS